jgi:photosystem II stability/assembly factor-like uncharacterized protein
MAKDLTNLVKDLIRDHHAKPVVLISGSFGRYASRACSFTYTEDAVWQNTADLSGVTNIYALLEHFSGSIQMIFAGTDDGIWRTFNEGGSWSQVESGDIIYCLAQDSSGSLYAGAHLTSQIYKSINHGDSWFSAGTLEGATYIRSLICTSGDILYAGTYPDGNVFKSTDHGDNWNNTGDLTGATTIWALAEDSSGNLYAGADNGKVYKSTNNGDSWTVIGDLGEGYYSVWCLLVDSNDYIYAGVGNKVYKSINAGSTWEETGELLSVSNVFSLLEDSDGYIYAGTSSWGNVYISKNGGTTWIDTSELANAGSVLSLLQDSSGSLYAGTGANGDVFKSVGGEEKTISFSDGLLSIDNVRINSDLMAGGLATIDNFSFSIQNREQIANVLATQDIENTQVSVSVAFTEPNFPYKHRIGVFCGVVRDYEWDNEKIKIKAWDDSNLIYPHIPQKEVTREEYPKCPPESIGTAIPIIYGDFVTGSDLEYNKITTTPTILVDKGASKFVVAGHPIKQLDYPTNVSGSFGVYVFDDNNKACIALYDDDPRKEVSIDTNPAYIKISPWVLGYIRMQAAKAGEECYEEFDIQNAIDGPEVENPEDTYTEIWGYHTFSVNWASFPYKEPYEGAYSEKYLYAKISTLGNAKFKWGVLNTDLDEPTWTYTGEINVSSGSTTKYFRIDLIDFDPSAEDRYVTGDDFDKWSFGIVCMSGSIRIHNFFLVMDNIWVSKVWKSITRIYDITRGYPSPF